MIIEQLRAEIPRLKGELSELGRRRARAVGPFDQRICEIERRLHAAEQMLAAYTKKASEPVDQPSRPTEQIDVTAIDVEQEPFPSRLAGKPLRPTSKRAKIIRATKALLKAAGPQHRADILGFVNARGLMGTEKNPGAYISVILSQAHDIFFHREHTWFLREEEDEGSSVPQAPNADEPPDKAV